VVKPDGHGTSNVGIFGGRDGHAAGDATNVVTDYAFLKGEARSPESAFAALITEGYRKAFAAAQAQVKDAAGAMAEVMFDHKPAYPPFKLDETSPAVQLATKAVKSLGLEPTYVFSNGGLDANWLDKHGIPTVTIGAGQYEIHTVNEYVDLPEFLTCCRLAVVLATVE
jgi:tripeptide aminopeptidase